MLTSMQQFLQRCLLSSTYIVKWTFGLKFPRSLERDFAHRDIDDESERAFLAVPRQVDHRADEPRITNCVGGDQQAPGQRATGRRLGPSLGHHQHEDSGHEQDDQRAVDSRVGCHPSGPRRRQTNGTQAIGTPASDCRAFSVAAIQLSPSGSRIDAGRTR